ncbi:hypothetical protein RND71_021727 [Anisodus tanguticus]|uniref:O-fucosyltransferase family protein n=1 Tax=Anisodus tanguticus TaxID=243964 RepID=A0AAE1V7J9_9SOLA|nr:hypothetical protein RND71_021727 [Anisodus tanguticus]
MISEDNLQSNLTEELALEKHLYCVCSRALHKTILDKDLSKFSDIYDEEFFVKTLENDVRVVDKVPDLIMERFDYNMTNVYNFRIKAWSSIQYYRDTVLPKLLEENAVQNSAPPLGPGYSGKRTPSPYRSHHVPPCATSSIVSDHRNPTLATSIVFSDMLAISELQFLSLGLPICWRPLHVLYGYSGDQVTVSINLAFPATPLPCTLGALNDRMVSIPEVPSAQNTIIRISPFANRLSFDVPPAVQRLRCLANYEALRFSNPILSLGQTLVARMKDRSANNSGKYISVHLRFEEDMVAFSCCIYDGGGKEKRDMDAARERGWRGKFTKRGKVIHPGAIRINGKCPLTPLEVGLMLRGMGFDKSTSIYLASGKIYDSERHMKPLLEMFPLLQTKEMLATPEELAPFQNYSSRMAAIDYTVCLYSEVFVTTQGGNFPHFLLGHRRFLYGGHSRTIRPDKRKLALLYDNPNIGWKSFKRQMLNIRAHSDSKGIEIKRPSDSVYSVPCPGCMCRSNKTEVSRSSSAT